MRAALALLALLAIGVAGAAGAGTAGTDANNSGRLDRLTRRLFYAAKAGEADTIRALIERGADPNRGTPTLPGLTPLVAAASKGQAGAAEALLEGGAKPDVQLSDGNIALTLAARGGHTEAVTVLLAAGADPNIQEEDGHTALHLAAETGDKHAVVGALLAGGANPTLLNKVQQSQKTGKRVGGADTAGAIAERNGHPVRHRSVASHFRFVFGSFPVCLVLLLGRSTAARGCCGQLGRHQGRSLSNTKMKK